MNVLSIIRASAFLFLSGASFVAAAQATAAASKEIDWVTWGKAAGHQHAADLAKHGLSTNYVNCGIRASVELASRVRTVSIQQRSVFLNAFESTCVDAATAAAETQVATGERR